MRALAIASFLVAFLVAACDGETRYYLCRLHPQEVSPISLSITKSRADFGVTSYVYCESSGNVDYFRQKSDVCDRSKSEEVFSFDRVSKIVDLNRPHSIFGAFERYQCQETIK